ncbi:DUF2252 family protein [Pseudoalteromonas phenolica]|uniref:DUF2252 domain-containing protein n=1 Tax=Pseudoalteromonas phenolica TaxID=161398 RepID=A0A0S2K6X4_9GAMM|nr:DUF2252 family protein [Pseudoalteromonas phenolica]ALO44070.1 hypothetical protein PP2015_3596 [Pseudoalteromonas phenolica]MBE0357051.1 hypothetical protein [Pseudoalteromonas phenolica O-BC30]
MERQQTLVQYFKEHDGCAPSSELSKHKKMVNSPFQFLRGSAPLMYRDLASHLITLPESLLNIPLTTIMGDCHTSNFGFLSEEGSHGETVVFSPNDFDDACFGHASWDLIRFLVSLPLARAEAEQIQAASECDKLKSKPLADEQQVHSAQHAFLTSYIETCERSLQKKNDNQTALTVFSKGHILYKRWQKALTRVVGGEAFMTKSTLAKEVDLVQWRFKQNPDKFIPLPDDIYENLYMQFRPFMDDEILDIVMRHNAGTGSNNLGRYYVLVGPSQPHDAAKTHIVEIKQQREAAPIKYFPKISVNNRLSAAHLTVNCQRKMQRRPDLILDDTIWQDKHWLLRSRHHARVGIDSEHFLLGKRAADKGGVIQYALSCGEALALAHMRGDRRSLDFQKAVVANLPSHLKNMVQIANDYVTQVIDDCSITRSLLQESL